MASPHEPEPIEEITPASPEVPMNLLARSLNDVEKLEDADPEDADPNDPGAIASPSDVDDVLRDVTTPGLLGRVGGVKDLLNSAMNDLESS